VEGIFVFRESTLIIIFTSFFKSSLFPQKRADVFFLLFSSPAFVSSKF